MLRLELQQFLILSVLPHFYQAICKSWFTYLLRYFLWYRIFLSATEAKITDLIGKILNPVFLLLLFLIFFLAFSNPMGAAKDAAFTASYAHNAFTNGFLEGYNTMDCLAALAFGITVITSICSLGFKREKTWRSLQLKAACLASSLLPSSTFV